jgi:hypothetical protein
VTARTDGIPWRLWVAVLLLGCNSIFGVEDLSYRHAAGAGGGGVVGPLGFVDVEGAALSTLVESNIVEVGASTPPVLGSISGQGNPEYRACGDAACDTVVREWSDADASIDDGAFVQLRLTSSDAVDSALGATMSVGSASGSWTVTTFDGSAARCSYVTSMLDVTQASSYLLTDFPIGDVAADRVVVAVITARAVDVATISSVAIDGRDAPIIAQGAHGAPSANSIVGIAAATAVGGTSTYIEANFDGIMDWVAIHTYRVLGSSGEAHDVGSALGGDSFDLAMPAQGCAIGGRLVYDCCQPVGATNWTGLIEDVDADGATSEQSRIATASQDFADAVSALTVTASNVGDGPKVTLGVSWAP